MRLRDCNDPESILPATRHRWDYPLDPKLPYTKKYNRRCRRCKRVERVSEEHYFEVIKSRYFGRHKCKRKRK